MSESLFIQQVGRVMRPSDGKTTCWLLDHVGNVGALIDGEFRRKHGLPDEEREWSLDGKIKHKGKGKKPVEAVNVAQCPQCYLAHVPAPVCPKCGHVYTIKARELEHVDGELVELTADRVAQLKLAKKQEVKGAKTLAELERIAAERGYSPGWAKHTFEAKMKKRAKFVRPVAPPQPTREELLAMSLDDLLKVEAAQGWPLGTAIQFFNDNHPQALGGR